MVKHELNLDSLKTKQKKTKTKQKNDNNKCHYMRRIISNKQPKIACTNELPSNEPLTIL